MSTDESRGVLLFDLDDTLYQTSYYALIKANKLPGFSYTMDDWVSYAWLHDKLVADAEMTEEEAFEFLYGHAAIEEVPLFDNVYYCLRILHDLGFEIAVVTSRPPNQRDITVKKVIEDLKGIVSLENIYIRENSMVSGDELKLGVAKVLSPVAYLDDNGKTLKYLQENLSDSIFTEVLRLMGRPWNVDFEDLNDYRHKTFMEFVVWLVIKYDLKIV